MADAPCGCDCPTFLIDESISVESQGPISEGSQSVDGDGFGVTLSGTCTASGTATCTISGLSKGDATCSIVRNDGNKAIRFAGTGPLNTLTLNGTSVEVIREANGLSLSLASCTVGSQVLLTASVECVAGQAVSASPALLSWAEFGALGEIDSRANNKYTNEPPKGFAGNECSVFEIYRDGQLVSSFESPDLSLYSLEYVEPGELEFGDSAITGPESVSDDAGSFLDPISITGTNSGSGIRWGWSAKFIPNKSGFVVAEYDGVASSQPANGFFSPFPTTGLDVYQVTAGVPFTITTRWMHPHPAGSQMNMPKVYLIPYLTQHEFPSSVRTILQEQGSYLIVAKRGGYFPPEMLSATGRQATPAVSYGSFVLCNERYAVAAEQVDDEWIGDIRPGPDVRIWRENPYVEHAGASLSNITGPPGFTPWLYMAGSYSAFASFVSVFAGGATNDIHGNAPLTTTANINFTRHTVPSSGKRGATPSFRFLQEGGYRGSLLDRPIQKLPLRFDKPVTGVTAAMCSISGHIPPVGSAQSLSVLSLKRVGNSLVDYVVEINTAAQVPNSQWTITFTPGDLIGTFASGTRSEAYPSESAFPEEGQQGIVYIDASTGDDYVWSGSSYGRPTDGDCDEYGTTKLACRFMWCLGKDKSIGRYIIDTTHDASTTMPTRASVSNLVDVVESRPLMKTTVSAAGFISIARTSTQQRCISDKGQSDFIPRMPDDQSTKTSARYGYFGVPTTIFPAQPALVSSCAAPSTTQRHASMFFGAADVTTLTITGPDGKAITVSSSGMPQNFWRGEIEPDEETEGAVQTIQNVFGISRQVKGKTLLEKVTLIVRLARGRLTYKEIQTTSVTEPVFQLVSYSSGKVYQSERDRTGCGAYVEDCGTWGGWSFITDFSNSSAATIIVPAGAENSLGELVDTNGGEWTISKG